MFMKKILILFIALMMYGRLLFGIWPTDGDKYVCGNFGTYEEGFHDGIDIPGIGDVTKCVAVTNLRVVKWIPAWWDGSFQQPNSRALRVGTSAGGDIHIYGYDSGSNWSDIHFYSPVTGRHQHVWARGFHTMDGLLEGYPSRYPLESGDVAIIDENNPGYIMRSTSAYDNKVMGVVNVTETKGSEGNYEIVLIGKTKVKATAENGVIKCGDLLVTSSIMGHVMRATEIRPGAIVGKSLQTLTEEKGIIEIFVNCH